MGDLGEGKTVKGGKSEEIYERGGSARGIEKGEEEKVEKIKRG